MNNNLEGYFGIKTTNSPTYNYFFALPEEKYGPLWTQIKILKLLSRRIFKPRRRGGHPVGTIIQSTIRFYDKFNISFPQ